MLEHHTVQGASPQSSALVHSGSRQIQALAEPGDLSPYGIILRHQGPAATRADFSQVFESRMPGLPPRLHVNRVEPTALPFAITCLERHPGSWQTFLPLDVSRYVVCVAGSRADGAPDPDDLRAWIIDGHTGMAFAPGVWHVGATVLDRTGHFAVVWPRLDHGSDTEWAMLAEPFTIHG